MLMLYLQSKGNANALSVPKSAVVISTERKYVLVMRNNNKIIKVDVTTGNETVDNAEVYGALQEGDKVIINANDEIPESKE